MTAKLRPFREEDTPRVVEIIRGVFAEYGFIFDPDGYDKDLLRIAERYKAGAFSVLDDGGRVIGCVGMTREGDPGVELHRLYLDPAERGHGYGQLLARHAIDWARRDGARRLFLWSDVRLKHAHAMYERLGFVKVGQRICEDLEKSHEYGYALAL